MSEFNNELNEELNNAQTDVTVDNNTSDIEPKNDTNSIKGFVFDWLEVLVHAIVAVVICFSFLFRVATIDGDSMNNTLIHGERVIITNLFYEPKAGDIVVISRNKENSIFTATKDNEPIIKRVIVLLLTSHILKHLPTQDRMSNSP